MVSRPSPLMRTTRVLGALRDSARDLARSASSEPWRRSVAIELRAAGKAARTLVPWLVRARGDKNVSVPLMALEHARSHPDETAFESRDETLTWAALADEAAAVARRLQADGVRPGDVVALLAPGSLRYIAAVFGASYAGATAALINSHAVGAPLRHALEASGARVCLVAAALADAARQAGARTVIVLEDIERRGMYRSTSLEPATVRADGDYVYIYTSGTTGLPKPCRVTHGRAITAGVSFGELLFELGPDDKLYCALPLYHSSGLLIGVGSAVMTRTPMVVRESFSATEFWKDVQRHHCTALLYIGELCRYLVRTPPCPEERPNPIRIAVGNGLGKDVWEQFKTRFDIPVIREFYGATEAPGAVVNLSSQPGSIGRIPLRRFSPMRLVRFDVETGVHPRDAEGRCILCAPGEVGELLVRLPDRFATAISEFRGYTDTADTDKKIVKGVLEAGDRYYRSGDLLRCDEDGFHYFVDRIGDTFRFKGENVSTQEVAAVLSGAGGVEEIAVVGVEIPGAEGRAGLAAVVCTNGFDARAFARTAEELPRYARPAFVRVLARLDTTATHKIKKVSLQRDGADPAVVDDPLFVRVGDDYVPLTAELWRAVVTGEVRL